MASKQSTSSRNTPALTTISSLADRQLAVEQEPVFADGDLGKVQKILFGQQLNASNEQFHDLEKRFDKLLAETNEKWLAHSTERFQQFEQKMETVIGELKQQSFDHYSEYTRTLRTLEASHSNLENLLVDADKRASDADTARQYDLQNTHAQWSSTLESTKEQLLQKLSDTVGELDTHKVDRKVLSKLLGTIATDLASTAGASNDESAESSNAHNNK